MANEDQRIQLDLTRWQDKVLTINGKFKGRVGDTKDYIPLYITSNGYPVDLRHMSVEYGGTDHDMLVHRHIIEDLTDQRGQHGDFPALGKFTLCLDQHTFQVPGHWNQFYIKFIDEKGKTVSTVDLDFDVIDDTFYAYAGKAANDYVEEFEKILKAVTEAGNKTTEDIQESGKKFKTDFETWINKYKQSLQDAMAEIDDPKDGLLVRYQALLEMTKQIQETLKQAQFHDRPFQVDTVATMKAYAPLMAGDLVITRGWDNYDDGHGCYWNIRVKHKDETPDEQNVISLANGMVAERNPSLVTADSLEDLMYGYSIKIVHGQADYPIPRVLYYQDAIGTEANGLGTGATGFGQNTTKFVPCSADYPDANTIVVRIPRNFRLSTAPYYKEGAWYVIDENKIIKIDLGVVDDAKAQAGEGKGSSYLSAGSGYFSKPTSPSDLRAVYIDEHTQRLLWRGV